MKKAQVEAISIVIIAGVIISLAGAAYFWGKPMIEKRSTIADVTNAKSFIVQLDREIVEAAKSGGTKTVSIPKISGASIRVNESGNEILFRFIATQPMLDAQAGIAITPVETLDVNTIGPYGGSPRIITLESERVDLVYQMTIRLKYRELRTDTPGSLRGYKIVLDDGGSSTSGGSPGSISASLSGTRTDSRTQGEGGELTNTIVRITLS